MEETRQGFGRFVRSIGVRQVRLGCGLVLFAYVLAHFTNHALGNISLPVMEAGLEYHVLLWHSLIGTALLYTALAVHASLGLWALYERRHFRWKVIEGVQLGFGLTIPFLLAAHLVGQRIALEFFGIEKGYAQVLYSLWVGSPAQGILQVLLLLVVWIHGCIGLHFWLRLRRFFRRAAPWLLAVAVLLPALALLGYYQAGRTILQLSASTEWQADNLNPGQIGTPDQRAGLLRIRYLFLVGWAGAIAFVFAARGLRAIVERRGGLIRLSYPGGRTVSVPRGLSVLESSMRFNIPHASVCGGRGRCSTCRIRIVGDWRALPAPSAGEKAVLDRKGIGADPAVRLACQLRPQSDLVFVPLLPPSAGAVHAHAQSRLRAGEERYVVSMFIDMRGSTRMGEKRLPFDTVFIINRFLAAISQAVIEAGGEPNQFLGDGLLALFGLNSSPAAACREALDAAARVAANVDNLNKLFAEDLSEPIGFGIGIHAGEVIVGDVGYLDRMVFTALGDPVNVAARLQDMTKALGCEVVLSDDVRAAAGFAHDALPSTEVTIRGRTQPMIVRTVVKARTLASLLDTRDRGVPANHGPQRA
jgi:adenylate cyclase